MNRWHYCILVLALFFGYPVDNQSGLSLNISHVSVNILL
ncbi:hypothetical protein M989_02339 [Kluyvera georgiana ATCC 51603]|uniref:Uncharacterized protein n=1 Tax=Kluyvera georgiana ATCC 51603 TaxID=1354264 RepID=A0A1B7JXS5_9ENTR|nr:hypothetical protein M989_02339 [Kluyvera georgiana ATCC 51603]